MGLPHVVHPIITSDYIFSLKWVFVVIDLKVENFKNKKYNGF
jgi:hypothetical protein